MNSLTFNGIRKPFVKVLERGRPYWAPRYNEIVTRGSKHRIRKTETEPIPIPVTLLIDGNSKEDLLNKAEEIADWLITDKEAPLIFDDRTNRTHWVVLEGGVDEDEIVSFSRASLEFISLYKTGEPKELNITPATQQIEVGGQVETPWIIEVSFAADTDKFEFWAGDIYLQLNYNFIKGDKLIVNYTGREVWLNGADLRKSVSMSSVFKMLNPNDGLISIKSSVPSILKYDERYY